MTKQSFLLVSLKEDKAKELAQVISNASCRKILDYLSEKKDATETELSKKLGIPISTVHYNIKHLIKASIIAADEYHYSEKGKEVNHYKLANKYIIIAPKTTYGIKEKLKSILPISLLALVGAGFVKFYTRSFAGGTSLLAEQKVMMDIDKMPIGANPMMEAAADEGARAVMDKAPEITQQVIRAVPNYALWFLLGCIFVIILVVIFELIKAKKNR